MIAICKWEDIPGDIFSLAALCSGDFDRICKEVGAKPKVGYVTYNKKKIDRYRSIFFKYSNGRFAQLEKEDSNLYINIDLQRIAKETYSACDLEELIDFVGIEISVVNKNLVPWIKWL